MSVYIQKTYIFTGGKKTNISLNHNPRKLLNTEAHPRHFSYDGNLTGLHLHLEFFHFFALDACMQFTVRQSCKIFLDYLSRVQNLIKSKQVACSNLQT